MRYLVIFLLLMTACSSSQPRGNNYPTDEAVESWETVVTGPLNTRIEEAVARGDTWPSSPVLIVFEIIGGDDETRFLSLTEEKNAMDDPDTVVIVMIRSDFLDDSVRGDWHRLVFNRMPDRSWRVSELRRAIRCWRTDSDKYQTGPCP